MLGIGWFVRVWVVGLRPPVAPRFHSSRRCGPSCGMSRTFCPHGHRKSACVLYCRMACRVVPRRGRACRHRGAAWCISRKVPHLRRRSNLPWTWWSRESSAVLVQAATAVAARIHLLQAVIAHFLGRCRCSSSCCHSRWDRELVLPVRTGCNWPGSFGAGDVRSPLPAD